MFFNLNLKITLERYPISYMTKMSAVHCLPKTVLHKFFHWYNWRVFLFFQRWSRHFPKQFSIGFPRDLRRISCISDVGHDNCCFFPPIFNKWKIDCLILTFQIWFVDVVCVVEIAVSVLPDFSIKKYFEITNFVAENQRIFLKSATDLLVKTTSLAIPKNTWYFLQQH